MTEQTSQSVHEFAYFSRHCSLPPCSSSRPRPTQHQRIPLPPRKFPPNSTADPCAQMTKIIRFRPDGAGKRLKCDQGGLQCQFLLRLLHFKNSAWTTTMTKNSAQTPTMTPGRIKQRPTTSSCLTVADQPVLKKSVPKGEGRSYYRVVHQAVHYILLTSN